MNLTIEGTSLGDIEEKILAMADDIRERRQLLSEGCTCDLTLPKTRHDPFHFGGGALRCHGGLAMCEARAERMKLGAAPLGLAAAS